MVGGLWYTFIMNKTNIIVVVIALVAVAFAGWFAYKQGYLKGLSENQQDIEFNLPGIR